MSKGKAAGVLRLVFLDAGTFDIDDSTGIILLSHLRDSKFLFFFNFHSPSAFLAKGQPSRSNTLTPTLHNPHHPNNKNLHDILELKPQPSSPSKNQEFDGLILETLTPQPSPSLALPP